MRNLLPLRSALAPTTTVAAFAATAAVTAGFVTAFAAPVAVTAAPAVKLVAADAETNVAAVATDGTTIRYEGLSVRIPAAGEGVQAAAQSTSGDLSITVSRSADGSVVVKTDKHEHSVAQAASASTSRANSAKTCTDSAYQLAGWKLPSFTWYYNPAGTPAALSGTASSAITTATNALSTACGQRALGLATTNGGQTTAVPQVGTTGNCIGNDGRNVIGWVAGNGKWLGMTCTYYKTVNGNKTVTGTDTALNTQYKFFTSTANCSGAYDLQSVVLHERGHSLGLNHVDQTAHASAVMTPALSACSVGKRTLGLGDFQGLVAMYGTK
ncbi:matrixin family metalloprotease [Cryptosporangium sp. NPDC048952]|uniref:matrixin family metalloprotease n=1 Tax=Cryptosporangium sp. NPDC048952 TaxID=3363961 RepID=UPI0037219F86